MLLNRQNKTESKFSRESSSSKPQTMQKQTNHLAAASWVPPEECVWGMRAGPEYFTAMSVKALCMMLMTSAGSSDSTPWHNSGGLDVKRERSIFNCSVDFHLSCESLLGLYQFWHCCTCRATGWSRWWRKDLFWSCCVQYPCWSLWVYHLSPPSLSFWQLMDKRGCYLSLT